MQTATEQQQTLDYDEVAKVARSIWEREGCPPGHDLEHWLRAEQQLLAAKSKQNAGAQNFAAKLRTSPAAARRSVTGKAS